MYKLLPILSLLILVLPVSGQNMADLNPEDKGKIIEFDVKQFVFGGKQANGLSLPNDILFPNADGKLEYFTFTEISIAETEVRSVKTLKGISKNQKTVTRISLTSDGQMNGIMHNSSGYFFIEPISEKGNQYLIYPLDSVKDLPFECEVLEKETEGLLQKSRMKKAASSYFPFGDKLKKYRLAVAATGEFVQHYGNKTNAINTIVSFVNAMNLIYELELSITFELVSATTSGAILFDNPATDPFTPDPDFASANASQNGFNTMHTNGTLNYNQYDVGHTVSIYSSGGISARGQAGGAPCLNNYKSLGWTEWSSGTNINQFLGMVVGVAAHEVGHQFGAGHTFNGSSGLCNSQWDGLSAVEPGSGTTLMGYDSNCTYPVDYTISGANDLRDHNYFHTFSVEEIFDWIDYYSSCYTEVSTGNHPPEVVISSSVTIPKGTPFILRGTASDLDGDPLVYSWDQMDVATSNDKGAMGVYTNGVGGYPAVNSITAPLFRSRLSSSPERMFPSLDFILNNDNKPNDNVGEHLSEVVRTIHFNFTARDYNPDGGGVDSKPVVVNVANVGPLKVASYNTATTLTAGNSYTFTWSVNSTNTIAPKVDILLSVDGGGSFPYVLKKQTNNDGSESITIPSNIPATTKARFKVVSVINEYAEFFDINNADIIIDSDCELQITYLTGIDGKVIGEEGESVFDLGLGVITGEKYINKSKEYNDSGISLQYLTMYDSPAKTNCAEYSNKPLAKIISFMVDRPGSYTISAGVYDGSFTYTLFTVFTQQSDWCDFFVGSNGYADGGVWLSKFGTVNLDANVVYYMYVYYLSSGDEITLNFAGPGDIYEPESVFNNYTYFAVNQADEKVKSVSSSSDFTSLIAGNYKVYGLNYVTGFNPVNMVGKTLGEALALSGCKALSSNFVELNISPSSSPCPPSQTLSGVAVAGKIRASNSISSTQVVNSGKNVTYQAAKSILLTPQTGSGFVVNSGAVFTAEIKNCD